MITVFSLENEKIEQIELEKTSADKNCWVRCVQPTDEELCEISKLTTIPESELHESAEEIERPKLNISNYIEIIYTAPYRTKTHGAHITLPVYFYIYKKLILTIEKEPLQALVILESAFKAGHRKSLLKNGPGYFTYYVIDKINDDFGSIIDKTTENLGIFKKQITQMDEKVYEDVYKASVVSSSFNQALIANIEVLSSLRKMYHRYLSKKDTDLFGELYDDALQILDRERIQRDMLASIVSLQSIITTQRLNKLMKTLTAIALIIMVPTLIASIYGMNFQYIPLANHPNGFYITLGIMGAIIFALLIMFKKMDWF